jgi:hypothetical protein
MTDEDLFVGALRRAVSTLEPPTARLVDAAVARGQRRRRVRRTVQAATGAVLLAAVVALALVLLPGVTSSPQQRRDMVGAPAATSHSPKPSRHSVVKPVVTPQSLLQQALAGLPRVGHTTHYTGRSMFGFVATEFIYNDGHGRAEVAVTLEYGAGVETVKQFMHDTHLLRQPRPDGSSLFVSRGYEYPGDPTRGAREWSVHLFRSDGVHVSITEWNSPQEKDVATTRKLPPFTIAQLSRWITHTHWQEAITVAQARRAASLFTPDH